MSKPMKEMIISEYQNRFGELDSAVLVEIRGMDANENNQLRGELAEKQIKVTILKNSLARSAFKGGKLEVRASGGGSGDLQDLNNGISRFIDEHEAAAEAAGELTLPPFLLEVSSPGLSSVLTSDLDFRSFKGFPVTVETTEPFKKKTSWEGTLVSRDSEYVVINLVRRSPDGTLRHGRA